MDSASASEGIVLGSALSPAASCLLSNWHAKVHKHLSVRVKFHPDVNTNVVVS